MLLFCGDFGGFKSPLFLHFITKFFCTTISFRSSGFLLLARLKPNADILKSYAREYFIET
jgi:hypothetical protein